MMMLFRRACSKAMGRRTLGVWPITQVTDSLKAWRSSHIPSRWSEGGWGCQQASWSRSLLASLL